MTDRATIEALGFVAAVVTNLSMMPQAYRVWRTGRTGDLSLATHVLHVAGLALWLAYAVLTWSRPSMVSSAVSLVPALYLLFKIESNDAQRARQRAVLREYLYEVQEVPARDVRFAS